MPDFTLRMQAASLLAQTPHPTDDGTTNPMDGNLCRCLCKRDLCGDDEANSGFAGFEFVAG